jgi:hypothetical protein
MWRIVAWAIVLLAPLPAARALDDKKDGGDGLKIEGKLTDDDPKDKVITRSPHKVHEFKMKSGSTYIIDMKSRQLDSFLRLEDSTGKQLAMDDDSGGFPDARIVHKATKDDTFRIIATSFDGKGGAYTLTVKLASPAFVEANDRLTLARKLMQEYEQAYRKNQKDEAAKTATKAESVLNEIQKKHADVELLGGLAGAQAKESLFHLQHLSLGKKAMEIEAEDLDGKQFKLSDYRGKVVVIDFWGNW